MEMSNVSEASPLPFQMLSKVTTNAATPSAVSMENIKSSIKRGLPRFHHLPGFQTVKGHDKLISLVAGGPSINREDVRKQLTENYKNGPIVACGSSHDWCVQNEFLPDYTVVCDPDPITLEYLKLDNTARGAKYLVASCCDPVVFDNLLNRGKQVFLWHCHSDELGPELMRMETDYQGIGGGCTVGLRAISISIMLGYTNVHIFGMDSCIDGDKHHAYSFSDPEKEALGTIYPIKIGTNTPIEKTYYCAGYQLAQVSHFKEFYSAHHHVFTPTFHGPGVLTDFMALCKMEDDRIKAEQEKVA